MRSRWTGLALDYDGTLAGQGGLVDAATLAALDRARAAGLRLLLVTGRQIESLETVFEQTHLFSRIVAENGAVLVTPKPRDIRVLAPAPPKAFVRALQAGGVYPLATGKVIVATREPNEEKVLKIIRDMGLELELIFNKGAVMILPTGVNKASGLGTALATLRMSGETVIGIGDGENDHSLLRACGLGVAVSNALESLKEEAQLVTREEDGEGVREILRKWDLGELG